MDRGGVEPLEQGGNPTPKNRLDSALMVHGLDVIKIMKKWKTPLRELFGEQAISIIAGLPPYFNASKCLYTCQISSEKPDLTQWNFDKLA